MLGNWIRVLSDEGSLEDLSLVNANVEEFDLTLSATGHVYVGQYFPFNNFYVEVSTASTGAATLDVEYWEGSQWRDAVDLLDGTKLSGATLGRTGVIQFSPDLHHSWPMVPSTSDTSSIPELSTVTIYDLYWMRFSPSDDIAATIKRISYAFCTNQHLRDLDPEVDNFLEIWGGSTKTNWNDQIVLASQHVVATLKSGGLIKDRANILRFDDIYLATAYKTLAIIFSRLGSNYVDKAGKYQLDFESLMSGERYSAFDQNNDANPSAAERNEIQSKGIR